MTSRTRWLLCLPAAALGALVGVVGTFVHGVRVSVLPLGLATALLLASLATAWGRRLTGGRLGAAVAALGWTLVVLPLSSAGPGGDLLVPSGPTGYGWLLGGLLVVGTGAALPPRRAPRGPAAATGSVP